MSDSSTPVSDLHFITIAEASRRIAERRHQIELWQVGIQVERAVIVGGVVHRKGEIAQPIIEKSKPERWVPRP